MENNTTHNPIKVLIVDDSALIRQTLSSILLSDPGIEVIATASDPYDAVKKIRQETPDVITLDIEMPGMDGLTFLKKIMNQHPIPVVMISSLTTKGSSSAIKALQYGAVEVIAKPKVDTKIHLEESKAQLCHAIKAASMASIAPLRLHRKEKSIENHSTLISDSQYNSVTLHNTPIIYIGASTGGTQIITHILQNLSPPCPPILIVQHMPAEFTRLFAQRLNKLSSLCVKEAQEGDIVRNSCVYVAPGGKHMLINKNTQYYLIELNEKDVVNRHRPSVDVLFNSALQANAEQSIAILLTGMGEDGAQGLANLKDKGASTITQEESSCAVYGMPRKAVEYGAAKYIYNPDEMIQFIQEIQNKHL